jgi:hypothetical protein
VLFVRFVCEGNWLGNDRVIFGLRRLVAVILGVSESPIRFVLRTGRFILALTSAQKINHV